MKSDLRTKIFTATALPYPREAMRLDASGNLSIGSATGEGTIHAKSVITTDIEVSMEDLNSDVFSAKLDTLINLWVTRYGNNWVDLDQVMEDVFYGRVYKRLKAMGELEVHFLTDRARFVCRRPE